MQAELIFTPAGVDGFDGNGVVRATVVVPPNDAYGVSLWGNSGDANQVQSIFRVNLKTLVVEAWNECT